MDLSGEIWRKSSRSHDDGDACIEISSKGETVAVRDSKDPDGPNLVMDRAEFLCFASALKNL
ncbi:DUF397 domain-containing protein [Actinomadura sp. GTD37]|uniref:DUF397 domain-containing protein n=1 Tax=Actinomadura sp. GTD37 TaxID=1778030 RepID=UPI0035C16E5F